MGLWGCSSFAHFPDFFYLSEAHLFSEIVAISGFNCAVATDNGAASVRCSKWVVFVGWRFIETQRLVVVACMNELALTPLDDASRLGDVQKAHVADIEADHTVARNQISQFACRVQANADSCNVDNRVLGAGGVGNRRFCQFLITLE